MATKQNPFGENTFLNLMTGERFVRSSSTHEKDPESSA